MSYSFAAGQGGATWRNNLVAGIGLTQQEGVCSRVGTDRRVCGNSGGANTYRPAWRGMDCSRKLTQHIGEASRAEWNKRLWLVL